jgi:hypothetical protein
VARRARYRLAALLVVAACRDDGAPPDGPWQPGPPLPAPRLEAGVVGFGGAVWVIGGLDEGLEVVADTWILDEGAEDWRAGPAAPAALTHPNLAVVDGRLYLLGGLVGRDFVPLGESWVLDGEAWTPLAAMPAGQERGAAAVLVLPDDILLAGGASADAALDSTIAYRVRDDVWAELPPLPSPRSHAMGAGGVVIGGLPTLDSSRPLDEVLFYRGDGWEPRAPMPTPRGGAACAELGGSVICAGGEAGSSALRVTEAYDPSADTWVELAPMPRGRAGTGGAALGGALWVPGGAHRLAFEPTDTVESFTP